jgi:hypothetical protein
VDEITQVVAGNLANSSFDPFRKEPRKYILGTDQYETEDGIAEWISTLRMAGPPTINSGRAADCAAWLHYSAKPRAMGFGWTKQWCELKGGELFSYLKASNVYAMAPLDLAEHRVYLPDSSSGMHYEREIILVQKAPPPGMKAFHCFQAEDIPTYEKWARALATSPAAVASVQELRGLKDIVGGFNSLGGGGGGGGEGGERNRLLHKRLRPDDFESTCMLGKFCPTPITPRTFSLS